MASSQIAEVARTVGWHGTAAHKTAEPGINHTLPVIDNTDPSGKNIRTSVDAYVSGQYVGKRGQIHEVTQRYTIFVSYGKHSQVQTMNQVRTAVVADYSMKYGKTFNITTIFVPELKAVPIDEAAPVEMYAGSRTFTNRYDRARYEIQGVHVKERTNVGNIKRRYGI